MARITPQDTETHIMGAGATQYGWYLGSDWNYEYGDDLDAPDDWERTYEMEDPESEGTIIVTVNHDALMITIRKIASGEGGTNRTCIEECKRFLADPEDADFDAYSADEVLQVLAYGRVVFV